jgi:site-specific DNA-methyltransferase (adenine-specific)
MAELKSCLFEIQQGDCMEYMKEIENESIGLVLTDIPYNAINRESNGLRNLDKEKADIMTFVLQEFLDEVYRISKGTIIIFCGKEQLSEIYGYFDNMQKNKKGTVRQLIWRKTNPSPMNGQHIYLSGIENAVWFKKRGGVFNARCKNTVFDFPCGRSKFHPTEKNHDLLKEFILDNSNEGDLIFDPCMGSGSHGVVAIENNRHFLGFELDEGYFEIAKNRIEEAWKEKNNG